MKMTNTKIFPMIIQTKIFVRNSIAYKDKLIGVVVNFNWIGHQDRSGRKI